MEFILLLSILSSSGYSPREDSHYLAEKHIRLFSRWGSDAVELAPRTVNRYKLRQDPGAWNALGMMKKAYSTPMRTSTDVTRNCLRPLRLSIQSYGQKNSKLPPG